MTEIEKFPCNNSREADIKVRFYHEKYNCIKEEIDNNLESSLYKLNELLKVIPKTIVDSETKTKEYIENINSIKNFLIENI